MLTSKSDFDAEIEILTYKLTEYLKGKISFVVNCSEALEDDKESILLNLERF